MKSLKTATLARGTLTTHDALQVYNGLDCCLTLEILEKVKGPNSINISKQAQTIYDFERAMQAPALELMQRGWKVDLFARDIAVSKLRREKDKLQSFLDEFVCILWDGGYSPLDPKKKTPGLNPASPKQMKEFFYERLNLPIQYKNVKGERKVSLDREALEKLEDYFHAKIFINLILAIRKRSKLISVLTSEVSIDGRMRTSYNVTGTETGRWSSSRSAFEEGTNIQNLTEEIRSIFIADPGMKLAYIDLSQAESRVLGFIIWKLFRDPSYLDACESGDLHTLVSQLIWKDLGWTGDLAKDKKIAEQNFYLHFSYRDMAKRGGHGTNYDGTPWTMAKHLKVLKRLVEDFQREYFAAFPGIKEYHRWVRQQINTKQYLETPLGMGRHFFGRATDDSVIREGIAFIPQSTVGQLLNLSLYRVWREANRGRLPLQILGQIHDAIVIQYPEESEDEIIPEVLKLMSTKLEAHGREMTIPSDAMVGWNWSKAGKDGSNPDGLKTWITNDKRTRQIDPTLTGLDRIIP